MVRSARALAVTPHRATKEAPSTNTRYVLVGRPALGTRIRHKAGLHDGSAFWWPIQHQSVAVRGIQHLGIAVIEVTRVKLLHFVNYRTRFTRVLGMLISPMLRYDQAGTRPSTAPRLSSTSDSKYLRPRAQFQFMGPGAAVLKMKLPIRFRNCIDGKQTIRPLFALTSRKR